MTQPTLYLIRHGEKPPKINGKDQDGLSANGLTRAQWLPHVFGQDSQYQIGYILAEKPKKDGSRTRPYDTVKPLSEALGLTIDDSVSRDDADGVAEAVRGWSGKGNVLICWEHGQLTDIAKAIGVLNAPEYPGERFDIIWTVNAPYEKIDSVTSEMCPGLDGGDGQSGATADGHGD